MLHMDFTPDELFENLGYVKSQLSGDLVQYDASVCDEYGVLPDLKIIRIDYRDRDEPEVIFYNNNVSVPFDGWVNISSKIILATALKLVELSGGNK